MSTWNTCEKDIVQIPSKNIEQTNAIYIYIFFYPGAAISGCGSFLCCYTLFMWFDIIASHDKAHERWHPTKTFLGRTIWWSKARATKVLFGWLVTQAMGWRLFQPPATSENSCLGTSWFWSSWSKSSPIHWPSWPDWGRMACMKTTCIETLWNCWHLSLLFLMHYQWRFQWRVAFSFRTSNYHISSSTACTSTTQTDSILHFFLKHHTVWEAFGKPFPSIFAWEIIQHLEGLTFIPKACQSRYMEMLCQWLALAKCGQRECWSWIGVGFWTQQLPGKTAMSCMLQFGSTYWLKCIIYQISFNVFEATCIWLMYFYNIFVNLLDHIFAKYLKRNLCQATFWSASSPLFSEHFTNLTREAFLSGCYAICSISFCACSFLVPCNLRHLKSCFKMEHILHWMKCSQS